MLSGLRLLAVVVCLPMVSCTQATDLSPPVSEEDFLQHADSFASLSDEQVSIDEPADSSDAFVTIAPQDWLSPTAADHEMQWAIENDGHCFRQHLREALELNRARKSHYERMSNGASRTTSNIMLTFDRLGLLTAWLFDGLGRGTNQRSGVDLVCEVIPSMTTAADAPLRKLEPLPRSAYRALPFADLRANLHRAWEDRDWDAVRAIAQSYAPKSEPDERSNCFTRHYLRTLLRLEQVVREHASSEAENYGWGIVRATIPMLRLTALADRSAADVQMDGVPILCADMPVVPTF